MTLEFCYTGEVRFDGTRVVLTHVGSSVAFSANVAPEFARIVDGIQDMCRYYGAGRTVVWSGRESLRVIRNGEYAGSYGLRMAYDDQGNYVCGFTGAVMATEVIEAFCRACTPEPHAPCPFCGVADGLQLAMGIRSPFVRCDMCSVSGPDGNLEP